jgi:hypothetical protein
LAAPLFATPFDGLYRPAGPSGEGWSCDPAFLGYHGAAFGIVDGYLVGREDDHCRLVEERHIGNQRIQYSAICSGEGEPFQERVIIARTPSGISLDYGGEVIYWQSCSNEASERVDGQWLYDRGAATIVENGMAFSVTCETFNPSSTLPVAHFAGYCPMCFPFDTTILTLSVDGRTLGRYEFVKVSNAEGWRAEVQSYPAWYQSPIVELMEGRTLTISERGGSVAEFTLRGSSEALGALRTYCN